MKKFLLTGLMLAVPLSVFFNQAEPASAAPLTPHYSFVNQWQERLYQEMQMFQNMFSHTSSQLPMPQQMQQQLQDQLNQILSQMNQYQNQQQQQWIDQNIARRSGLRKLPRQSGNGRAQQNVNSGLKLAAGDNGVSQKTLQSAAQILQNISLPTLQTELGAKPSSGTEVALFSSQRSYGQALLQAGVPQNQISAIITNTGGITIGNTIWIPLYNLKNQSDLANVLTHELTHIIFNQQGIGDSLPTWINEGTAWTIGLNGEAQVSQSAVQQETARENQAVSRVAQAGKLLPLNAGEDDILSAGYNVEWVDYLAVQQLIKTYGADEYKAFLADIPQNGVEASFQQHFGQSVEEFEQSFSL
ncbi:hypothetical protein [Tumebacillus flagellatus]|uniref:Peptidase MA-like domain-containing protein n=1 Tax=Tumebacillus flagellatus TaxID=1157490 RepID=A0A074LKN9_9BACL|nr:hypothetical protein [Tumebacillus flagellatus]KEO81105.1 hypothetical protein EL26_22465 [Tumebacillus flagellatus]